MDRRPTPGRAGPPRPARRRLTARHRRRRTGALAALAALALLIGMVSGAMAGGGQGHHAGATSIEARHVRERLRELASHRSDRARDEQAAENAAINRTLAYTPFVRVAGAQHREVALTFDDGPGPYTTTILAELSRYHVSATFFEVGVLERYFHGATAAVVAAGDPIGDHTYSHAALAKLTRRAQEAQLLQQTAAIGDWGAAFPRLFRPPYGLWNRTTLELLRQYRMLMVLWTVDTDDYLQPGADVIVQRALQGARPGAIILLHDAGGDRSQTVAALPRIIAGLRARGYQMVSVPRLLLDNPAPRDQDVTGLVGTGG